MYVGCWFERVQVWVGMMIGLTLLLVLPQFLLR